MELLPIPGTSSELPEDNREAPPRRSLWDQLRRPSLLFLVIVVVPVLVAIAYFGFLASDVYISESQFVVRTPQKPAQSPLGAILETAGFTNGSDEANAAQSFAASRDALKALNQNRAFERAYTRPDIFIFDRFNPFGLQGSFENLYEYFQGKVSLDQDNSTDVITLTVRAFSPQDAYRFNRELLSLSENTINKLNERGRLDLVHSAEAQVAAAKAQSQAASIALATYRGRAGIVDPQVQAQAQIDMISGLENQLIGARTELAQVQRYAPQNPRIPVIRTEIATIESQIKRELGNVTTGRGSLAGKSVEYERLSLESDFADKQLTASLASLEQARQESLRKQAYVERIVEPNLPDYPVEPRRLRDIFATVVVSLLVFGILRMVLLGLKEHVE